PSWVSACRGPHTCRQRLIDRRTARGHAPQSPRGREEKSSMKGSAVGLALGLSLSLMSSAQAKTATIDFTGDQPVAQGLTLVNNNAGSDGVLQIVKKGGKNVAQTGGTDAARYLYLQIVPAFKQGLKSVWVTVDYFDEGKDNFKLEY